MIEKIAYAIGYILGSIVRLFLLPLTIIRNGTYLEYWIVGLFTLILFTGLLR